MDLIFPYFQSQILLQFCYKTTTSEVFSIWPACISVITVTCGRPPWNTFGWMCHENLNKPLVACHGQTGEYWQCDKLSGRGGRRNTIPPALPAFLEVPTRRETRVGPGLEARGELWRGGQVVDPGKIPTCTLIPSNKIRRHTVYKYVLCLSADRYVF